MDLVAVTIFKHEIRKLSRCEYGSVSLRPHCPYVVQFVVGNGASGAPSDLTQIETAVGALDPSNGHTSVPMAEPFSFEMPAGASLPLGRRNGRCRSDHRHILPASPWRCESADASPSDSAP
jgi:hypothetical protein